MSRTKTPWTLEQDITLMQLLTARHSTRDIATALDRKYSSVKSRICFLEARGVYDMDSLVSWRARQEVSESAIAAARAARQARREHFESSRVKNTRWTAEEDALAKKMHEDGADYDEIAQATGRSEKSVESRLHQRSYRAPLLRRQRRN